MRCILSSPACRRGETFPVVGKKDSLSVNGKIHILHDHPSIASPNFGLATGSILFDKHNIPLFQVSGYCVLPFCSVDDVCIPTEKREFPPLISYTTLLCPLLTALGDIEGKDATELAIHKNGWSLAIITLSDKGFEGKRKDTGGMQLAKSAPLYLSLCIMQKFLICDDAAVLKTLLYELALRQYFDLIITTGGTGLGARDITPQTTASALDLELPGIIHVMMAAGLEKTGMAALSRSCAGIIGKCLVLNLPGSPKAIVENMEPVWPILEHALLKLHGDQSDCGREI